MNIVMWIGKDIVEVNGLQKKIDAPPVILKESTMVPLRFISDSFGAKTLWDQDTKKITISWPK